MEEKETIVEAGEKILGVTKVQKDWYITIPKRVREFLGIASGDDVTFEKIEDNIWVLNKA